MIEILSRLFIKNNRDYENVEVRQKYGVLCGAVGVALNILLFAAKLFVGLISSSVAIMADALNNLSDAGSSIITMIGFRLSGHKPDPEHPFGHGRFEYITGLVVSFLIILMGFELLKSSFAKIIHPEEITASIVTFIILAASILVKLYMYYYNHAISKKISSAAMNATAKDSLSDAISTTVVMLTTAAAMGFGIHLDGWCGLLVAVFILYTGISSLKDTVRPLLGSAPDPAFVKEIEEYVTSHEHIIGIHDLIIHDYGPGRMMISLHAEVPADGDIMEMHDTVDNIEVGINEKWGCQTVIHMDPIAVNDEETKLHKSEVISIVEEIDPSITIHDFRMVKGPTHTNLIFDVVLPYEVSLSPDQVTEMIKAKVESLPGRKYAVLTIDRPFV